MLILLAAITGASAECAAPYARENYMSDLAIGTGTLVELEGATFQAAATSLENGLSCIIEAVPAAAYATAYRYIGVMHWVQGDEEGSRRWFRTALELDP